MPENITLSVVIVVMELLFMASVVAVVSKKFRFPFTIGLVIMGLLIGWFADSMPVLQPLSTLKLTPDIVLFLFLPVLLFESAFNLDTRSLTRDMWAIFMLAVPTLLISTGVVGIILHYILGLPIWIALLFGALISATDPVAVVALFKEMGAPKRLHLLVEGESLFNDGTAFVVFKIILGIILAGTFTSSAITSGVVDFLTVSIGGTIVGIAMGVLFSRIIEKVWDIPLVEIAMSTILAHSSFIIAEHLFHVSGVIATVLAGLTLGSYGRNKISPGALEHMEAFWEYFAFVCNSLIFLLVGLSIDLALFADNFPTILLGTLVVLVARAIAVYAMFPVVGFLKIMESVSRSFQTVIFWGGLRGALAIVMALSIPETMPFKSLILTLTFGVVLTNLILNGLTTKPLMIALGLDSYSQKERLERLRSMLEVKKLTLEQIMPFSAKEGIDAATALTKKSNYSNMVEAIELDLRELRKKLDAQEEPDLVMIHCLLLEKSLYQKLYVDGMISEDILKELTIEIDRYVDLLREGVEIFARSPLSLPERLSDIIKKAQAIGSVFRISEDVLSQRRYERERARLSVTTLVLQNINLMQKQGVFSEAETVKAKSIYSNLRDRAVTRMETIWGERPEHVDKVESKLLDKFCLRSELEAYKDLYSKGAIEEKIFIEMQENITKLLRRL